MASTSVEKFHLPHATHVQRTCSAHAKHSVTVSSVPLHQAPAAWPRRPRRLRLGAASDRVKNHCATLEFC